ncbi:MAG: DUF116 domain-containing protein [bacterium]|nr:DUF116 domain-containing protein [bacterium]
MPKNEENTRNGEYLGDLWKDPDLLADFEPEIEETPMLFLLTGGIILFIVAAVWGIFLYLTWPRLGQIHPYVPLTVSVLSASVFGYIVAEYVAILLTVRLKKPMLLPLGRKLRGAVKLSPIALKLARMFGKTQDRMAHSFVEANNAMVLSYSGKTDAPALVLLPRCIQNRDCNKNIVEDADECVRCGKCPMAELMELRDEYENVVITVLTGGSVAESLIRNTKPGVVIGVACEREVWMGIELVDKIPVVGICNTRPEGPCIHTRVEIEDVRGVLDHFANRKLRAVLTK